MTLARLVLANQCLRIPGVLAPFVQATLLERRSLPRILAGRLALRIVWRLMIASRWLAPVVTWE